MNEEEALNLEFCKCCGERMAQWYEEKMRKKKWKEDLEDEIER